MRIQAKEIEACLGGSQILRGAFIEAKENDFIGLIGPNGSGKSTLLKCVYRVLAPSGGAIYLDGRALNQYTYRDSAKRIAVLAQHNYYNFDFSVQDVVLMGRSPHKRPLEADHARDHQIVREALEMVGMADFYKRSFSTLSGGEQQRVILARALAQQTPCLILDEPTNHMDIKYQLQIMDIVKGLNRTVISAIHDLNIAAMYCTYIYVLRAGRVVASGTPEDVLTPETIRAVYEVEAEVYKDQNGMLRILFQPANQ